MKAFFLKNTASQRVVLASSLLFGLVSLVFFALSAFYAPKVFEPTLRGLMRTNFYTFAQSVEPQASAGDWFSVARNLEAFNGAGEKNQWAFLFLPAEKGFFPRGIENDFVGQKDTGLLKQCADKSAQCPTSFFDWDDFAEESGQRNSLAYAIRLKAVGNLAADAPILVGVLDRSQFDSVLKNFVSAALIALVGSLTLFGVFSYLFLSRKVLKPFATLPVKMKSMKSQWCG
jgi:hypothetical protein